MSHSSSDNQHHTVAQSEGYIIKKQPEVTEATKNRIIDSFWILFQYTPIDKITIGNLSAVAGIHRSSFYRYFPDVYKVFEVFQNNLLKELEKKMKNIVNSTSLSAYTEKASDILLLYADELYRLLNYEDCGFKSSLTDIFKALVGKALNIDDNTPKAEYYIVFIISSMLTNFNFWYEHQKQYSLQEINYLGQQILLNGLPPQFTKI